MLTQHVHWRHKSLISTVLLTNDDSHVHIITVYRVCDMWGTVYLMLYFYRTAWNADAV